MRRYRRRLEPASARVGDRKPERSARRLGAAAARSARPDRRARTRARCSSFGAVHGNETAGVAIARRLDAAPPPEGMELWIVDDLNPDGTATAHPPERARRGPEPQLPPALAADRPPRRPQYPGTHALEPETRIARGLIRRLRPRVTIWFHQPLALVDRSGGSEDLRIERRFARLSGLPLRRIPPLPGHGDAMAEPLPPRHGVRGRAARGTAERTRGRALCLRRAARRTLTSHSGQSRYGPSKADERSGPNPRALREPPHRARRSAFAQLLQGRRGARSRAGATGA